MDPRTPQNLTRINSAAAHFIKFDRETRPFKSEDWLVSGVLFRLRTCAQIFRISKTLIILGISSILELVQRVTSD